MKRITATVASIACCASIQAADIRVATNITEDTIWTNDNTYILDAQVYVVGGASLTIEPGTVVKGAALDTAASALIVSRGSKIYALGSPSDPVIFTAEADPLDGSLDETDTNLWGGVIILGAAPLNSQKNGATGDFTADPPVPFTDNIEGLENSPDNDWTEFGGVDPEDSSGIFRYVSIRHGGAEIGANNEINGLSMGGVGSGTVVEFVEVFANKDDGFEWFGGTVNARFLVAAFGNDDSFDYDQGWTGKGQFWFSLGTTGVSGDEQDHGGEHDGTADFAQVELALDNQRGMGTIYNATYIGPGSSIDEGVFELSDDAGARYYNSIFTSWGHAVDVKTDALSGFTDLEDGVTRIDFRNNIWFDLGTTGSTLGGGDNAAAVTAFLTAAGKGNSVEDPMFESVSRTADGSLDPRPMDESAAFSNALAAYPADSWYIPVSFQGAFGASNWMYGWTKLSQDGYLAEMNGAAAAGIGSISAVIRADEGGDARGGLQITGEVPQLVIIRAKGPKLVDGGIPLADVMPNPQVRIADFFTQDVLALETGWTDREDAIEVLSQSVGLATLRPDGNRATDDTVSAVALLSLNPGVYTIFVTDEDGAGGKVQIEAYGTDR